MTSYTRASTWRALALATAVSGTLLLLAGFAGAIWSGGSPLAMLTNTARGVIGDAAARDSLIGPTIGLLMHFALTGVTVALYGLAATRLPALNRHWRASGIGFGVIAWGLLAVIASPRDWPPAFLTMMPREAMVQMLLCILLLGLPTARFFRLAQHWRC